MSKLSFRAKALDASKPMPIYMAEELPDLPDYSAINRAVPQMPSGMEKEEECEHHLQRAICAGLIIPTPEVTDMPDPEFYDKVYPANYKPPRQLIHMQPFALEQDTPDYDMDSDDDAWLQSQTQRLELTPLKFEEMMDRLEKSSGQTVVTLNEAKALLKEDDDLIIAVYDYWLNKRLKTQQTLIPSVKTEHRIGTAPNNPYIAFRRRTEKMQTRKNRKNDETSYEKMLKLRRELYRAVTLLDLVKRREKTKREYLHLTLEVYEKQYQAKDFSGMITAEASASKAAARPAFQPIFHNHYSNQSWVNKTTIKDEVIRKEKRQYKKRKHKAMGQGGRPSSGMSSIDGLGVLSSDEESTVSGLGMQLSPDNQEETDDEGQFAFRRNQLCSYQMPRPVEGNWPWCSKEDNGQSDKRFRFTLTSLSNPRKCIGFARRRVGRGGRIILDRVSTDHDHLWRNLDYTIIEPEQVHEQKEQRLTSSQPADSLIVKISSNSNNNNRRTDIKSEFSHYKNSSEVRTSVSELLDSESMDGSSAAAAVKMEIKQEPLDLEEATDDLAMPLIQQEEEQTKEELDEMVDMLRTIRRDWLHFRPKTPPPEYEPPCTLLPPDDNILSCLNSANFSSVPFSLELQPVDDPMSTLLDSSIFTTDPFVFNPSLDTTMSMGGDLQTDTRQPLDGSGGNVQTTGINLNVNVGLNTLTSSVNNSSSCFNSNVVQFNDDACDSSDDRDRTIGCSWFNVSDWNAGRDDESCKALGSRRCSTVSSRSNEIGGCSSVAFSERKVSSSSSASSVDNSVANTNGLLTQFGLDVSTGRTKNNKMLYAYPGGVGYPNASSGSLSLHTSAHPLTLNSHSANILEIPLANDAETVTNKLVNSTETSGSGPNNKNKSIVQKNNLVMEVT